MAPIFTAHDIATLLSSFPPGTPSPGKPSLVRSFSGDHHVHSTKVLERFQRLLDSEQTRIRISTLRQRLRVHATDWIFDCVENAIHSRDQQWILTKAEWKKLYDELHSRAKIQFVSLDAFLAEFDVTGDSWEKLCESLWRTPRRSGKAEVYVAEPNLASQTMDLVHKAIDESQKEKLDLSQRFSNVPSAVLAILGECCLESNQGAIESINEHVTYTPHAYEFTKREEEDNAREARTANLAQSLEIHGFVEVFTTSSDEIEAVKQRYDTSHGSHDLLEEILRSASRIVVVRSRLEAEMSRMRKTLFEHLDSHPTFDGDLRSPEVQNTLLQFSSNRDLATMILNSSKIDEIDSALAEIIRERKTKQFETIFHSMLMVPAQLYITGLAAIDDLSLRERLDAYILQHLKSEAIPQLEKAVREGTLLSVDKSRGKDFEKFIQASKILTGLADLASAASKFAKKCKMPVPLAGQLSSTKHAVLKQTVKRMSHMTRSSDVLQNVTWILLAERCDGLFMSPGKDTSRIIKQYQQVGDGEKASQLAEWRDKIKKGQDTQDDIRAMAALASRCT